MNPYFLEKPPSQNLELLQILKGSTIQKIIRCSWESFENFDEHGLYSIEKKDFFRFTTGAVIFILNNGFEIGFSSQEDLNSIITWCEQNGEGVKQEEYFANDDELVPIEVSNTEFSTGDERAFLNKKIDSIRILKQEPIGAKFQDLPNEVGIEIIIEGGKSMILAHNLISSSDSFAITYKNEIDAKLFQTLISSDK